jgi:hypothetical protein
MYKAWLPLAACLLGVALVLLGACWLQGTDLESRVVDEIGHPFPGAVARIKATTREAVADQEGHFRLEGL